MATPLLQPEVMVEEPSIGNVNSENDASGDSHLPASAFPVGLFPRRAKTNNSTGTAPKKTTTSKVPKPIAVASTPSETVPVPAEVASEGPELNNPVAPVANKRKRKTADTPAPPSSPSPKRPRVRKPSTKAAEEEKRLVQQKEEKAAGKKKGAPTKKGPAKNKGKKD
jgi:hypothetical protein